MAERPVFCVLETPPFTEKRNMEFEYFGGFSKAQKQRCINSLQGSYLEHFPQHQVLEISSKSELPLGIELSAFNLMIDGSKLNLPSFSVESAFQGSKVFEEGGPFTDLLEQPSIVAKKDQRLRNSGEVLYFEFFGTKFQKDPVTFFYHWIYINTLQRHTEFHQEVLQYDAFTDIEFNPKKSFNCQAESVSIFCGLHRTGRLEEALQSKEDFLRLVYGEEAVEIP